MKARGGRGGARGLPNSLTFLFPSSPHCHFLCSFPFFTGFSFCVASLFSLVADSVFCILSRVLLTSPALLASLDSAFSLVCFSSLVIFIYINIKYCCCLLFPRFLSRTRVYIQHTLVQSTFFFLLPPARKKSNFQAFRGIFPAVLRGI